ncbi:AAA family ATPase [Paenibacillus physcomitrellae]|uniref:ATPase n=1 Tax=Paenibacillus physcomitrellae TaxID=1619311 RepID=A0ABQ1GPV4_9BACL|nr:AAA family ATPase [Paenibacillus physcomitrellae]GGA47961.1 ATPase [Paenibacillus physcomitrellae]
MSKLVFFLGPAGAGKTSLAKALCARRKAAFFDMDVLLRPAANALMSMKGLDPADRDSSAYKELCRDLGYRITMDAALDNVVLDTDVFVVGPFTQETAMESWIEDELQRIGRTLAEVEVKVVLVRLADESLYRSRIEARRSPLDAWKLTHWDEFRHSLGPRSLAWPIPESSVLELDNSEPDMHLALETLERFIYGE